MCVGRRPADELECPSEIYGSELSEEGANEYSGAGGSLIHQLLQEGLYDGLPYDEGEPEVVWIYGSDNNWHLCVECAICYSLMTYPGGSHNCPGNSVDTEGEAESVETVRAVLARATTLEVEGQSLLCEESLGSSNSFFEEEFSSAFDLSALGDNLD